MTRSRPERYTFAEVDEQDISEVHLRYVGDDVFIEPVHLNARVYGAAAGVPGEQTMSFAVDGKKYGEPFSENMVVAWNTDSWPL